MTLQQIIANWQTKLADFAYLGLLKIFEIQKFWNSFLSD